MVRSGSRSGQNNNCGSCFWTWSSVLEYHGLEFYYGFGQDTNICIYKREGP
ncbi:coiled-coil domain-containing protein 14 isoform X1 [Prionailurus iriomotensis]